MNENAERLVEALRSGKYEQVRDKLHEPGGGYCCLGVACDLSGLGRWVEYLPNSMAYHIEGEHSITRMLGAVRRYYGFTTVTGATNGDKSLISMNDSDYTFEEIADFIESEPEGLFVGVEGCRDPGRQHNEADVDKEAR
jgi:hypothetical protein